MAISRKKKEELLELYKEQIEGASAIVFTDYRGVSVPQIQSLRAKLNETNTTYMVVKNSLMRIALEQLGRPEVDGLLAGTRAAAFLGEDIGKSVTALQDWIRVEKIVEVQGALLGDAVLGPEEAGKLADLPTREETLAMILGAISAPASNLARILAAPQSSLARVINAHVEQQQEAEAA